jgi:hypothetical protein
MVSTGLLGFSMERVYDRDGSLFGIVQTVPAVLQGVLSRNMVRDCLEGFDGSRTGTLIARVGHHSGV